MMRILQRLFITVVILLGCNFAFAEAEIVVETNGRMRVVAGEYNRNGIRPWKYISGKGPMFYHEYSPHFDKSLAVRHAASGAVSKSKVPVQVLNTVSRQSVLSGAFGLVKRGAALGTRLSGWGTAAYFAYEAYQAVKGDLESQGYHYDESKEEFYKDWAARSCIWERDDNGRVYDVDCYGVDSSVTRHQSTDDPKKQEEIKFLMEAQMERLARPYWKVKQKILADGRSVFDWNKYIFDKCYFNWNGGSCSVKKGSDERSVIHFALKMNQRELLTPQKFLQIATPSIDRNPTPFVEGTGRPGYSEDVQVSPGTVVTLGPVTGPDNKPVQIQITFGRDSNGKTTATVNTTPRPDLTPGSPAAPKANPSPTPNGESSPNPEGKPGSQPDPTPDGNPSDKTKPDPDDSPGGKDKPKPDDKPDPDGKEDPKKDERPKEDDKPKEDGGLLCEVFPNILACDKQPEAGEEPDLTLPEEVINVEFEKSSAFQESAECPAPVTFNVTVLGASKTFAFSFEHACEIASRLRYMLVALAWVVAAFFCIRAVSREV